MKAIAKIKRYILATFAIIFMLGACTEHFEELNTDPNNPTDVPAINIFSHALEDGINRYLGSGWINHTYLACWSQQWCKVQYIDEDRYLFRVANINAFFQDPYAGELMNLQVIIDKTAPEGEEEDPALNAAARIFRAWDFQQLTDVFGDVPYSEALQGNIAGSSVFPKYDSQESIYMDLIAELEAANTILSTPRLNMGSGDLLFGGDPEAWRKFGNSLLLRVLNRCSAVYGQADSKIAAILGNPSQYPIMTSNADNAEMHYPGVLPYRNGTYNTLYTRTDQAISQTMVNWLKDRNDPRLPIYAQPIESDSVFGELAPFPTYVGQQNGAAAQPVLTQRSMLGLDIAYDPAAPLYVLTYDEVEFIKAEYYLRSGNDGGARTAYETAIAASMERWGATYDAGTYLADPLNAWDGGAAKDKLIGEAKWAAIFGEGVEAYAEVRRTGYPSRVFEYELEATEYPGLGLPVRLPYAQNEESYNPDNLDAAKSAQSIPASNAGMFGAQVWWHTKQNPIPTQTDPQGPGNW